MIWSPQQETALVRVDAWMKESRETRKPFFWLAGYAGTGKTTLAKHLAAGLDHVEYAGPTGKSAAVMREMGCIGARTGHSLIYRPADKSRKHLRELQAYLFGLLNSDPVNETEVHKTRENIAQEEKNLQRPMFSLNLESDLRGADLLVLDEGSMFDLQFGQDLISFEVPILVLGDPAQLPPVRGAGFFTRERPDFLLTEVHRQALDSPVLWLATRVREGNNLDLGTYGESAVLASGKITPEEVLAADQVLVGRNATRHASNRRMRELRGFAQRSAYPLEGERLVCLRNNHELNIMNGGIFRADADATEAGGFINLAVRPVEGGDPVYVSTHPQHFLGCPEKIGTWDRRDAEEFDYGSAMTVHKFQGSQDKRIVLFDEWFNDHRREWLYTGLTRARESVKVVRS